MRVFFDTNVLVSAYTARGLSADLFRLVLAEHELLIGEVNLTEFRRVLRQRFLVPLREIVTVERDLRRHTVTPRPERPVGPKVRDPDDQLVLASAIVAEADLLVTGDKDLLDVANRSPVRILSPREAWLLLTT